MKKKPIIVLIFVSLIVESCATSSGFNVKAIDASSQLPISGVKIEQLTLHYTGMKSLEKETRIIGNTDHHGIYHLDKLNVSSRDHTLTFLKPGYGTMHLVTRELNGKRVGYVTKQNSDQSRGPITITEDAVVTIPMPRK